MTVGTVGGTGATPSLTSAISQTAGNQTLGQQDFLKLLTTQLSNQDPMAPQDQSQTLAQLAQFSTLQGINSISTTAGQQQAADLLGKNVTASVNVDNVAKAVSGTVTSVRWDSSGVHFTVSGSPLEVTLAQITSVSDPTTATGTAATGTATAATAKASTQAK